MKYCNSFLSWDPKQNVPHENNGKTQCKSFFKKHTDYIRCNSTKLKTIWYYSVLYILSSTIWITKSGCWT